MSTCTAPSSECGELVGSQACAKFVARATEEMGQINIYEIYADVCRDWRADADGRQLLRALAGPGDMLRQGISGFCIVHLWLQAKHMLRQAQRHAVARQGGSLHLSCICRL